MDRFRISSAFARRLDSAGVSRAQVLGRAGLPPELFDQEKVLLTTEEFFRLYQGVAEASPDPAIGLKLGGAADRIEYYDPLWIAAICSRSLRDALGRLGRYKQLTCPEKIELVVRGDACAVHFDWLLAQEQEPAVLVDCCFAWIMSIAHHGTGRPLRPQRVEFQRREADRSVYQRHFQCPIKFRASRNALVFSKADTDAPFLTFNADLLAAVAPPLEAELKQQLAERDVREQVKGTLKRLLAGQRPGLREVARELRLSTRTLQRRLTGAGITFQDLMKEARRELARHYLLHSSLALTETAYLLGYDDVNSFFRAFHDWEGTSPGHWRAMHLLSA